MGRERLFVYETIAYHLTRRSSSRLNDIGIAALEVIALVIVAERCQVAFGCEKRNRRLSFSIKNEADISPKNT